MDPRIMVSAIISPISKPFHIVGVMIGFIIGIIVVVNKIPISATSGSRCTI